MNNITENNHGTGGIKVSRNEMVASFGEVVADSPVFDWNKGFDIRTKVNLSLKDQNGSGSCGGQASSYLTEAVSGTESSARSIYAKCFVPGGGSSEQGLMNTIMNIGVSTEKEVTSYENGQPPSEVFMETDYPAQPIVLRGTRPVYVNISFDEMAVAILQNKGIVIGISGQNNGTWLSNSPVAPNLPPHDHSFWNHWVYAGFAGMVDGKKKIGFKNSWGNVGDNGWQFLDESWTPYIWCAWSMLYQPKGKPKHTFTRQLKYGQSSKDIISLQDVLRYEGLFNNVSTGYFGLLTAGAVMSFQKKYNVASISDINSLQGKQVGPLTLAKLNQLYK